MDAMPENWRLDVEDDMDDDRCLRCGHYEDEHLDENDPLNERRIEGCSRPGCFCSGWR